VNGRRISGRITGEIRRRLLPGIAVNRRRGSDRRRS